VIFVGLLRYGNIALKRWHVWLMEMPAEVKQRYNNSVAVQQLWRVVESRWGLMPHYFGQLMNAAPHAREAWQHRQRVTAMPGYTVQQPISGRCWRNLLASDLPQTGDAGGHPFFRYSREHTLKVMPWW
jgi:hypothetical protein